MASSSATTKPSNSYAPRTGPERPLGPIDAWPQVLRTTVTLCLASNFPISIIWGPDHIQVYNDAYRIICGDAHPAALGQSYRVTWVSAWPVVGEPFERALNGETSYLENQRMFLTRNGYLEETFFTFSLSPNPGRGRGHWRFVSARHGDDRDDSCRSAHSYLAGSDRQSQRRFDHVRTVHIRD